LSRVHIAARVGTTSATVVGYLRRRGISPAGPAHPAARAYAGRLMPDQPATVTDRDWGIFCFACEHTYPATAERFGMTPQGIQRIVKVVLAALTDPAPSNEATPERSPPSGSPRNPVRAIGG
jgi:hypothetical protein